MHIKQVIIRGFKTYKEQVDLTQDLSPGVNVVVGFNGSGKSNFFQAILFVLSDQYGTLRAETRKSLLHEGSGAPVLTAFVEIQFDNADRRMPIDKDIVHVRRSIGVKKDDYSLDGKVATRSEVFSLLESCGFSRSNPYYIVQQGKVAELTLMTDEARLDLLKEVSGASIYDERKAESQKILAETMERRKKTAEVLDEVEQRIQELEAEQKDLHEYQQLEKRRRGLEYVLVDHEWRGVQEKIEQLGLEKQRVTEELHEAQRCSEESRAQLAELEGEVQRTAEQRLRLEAQSRRQEGERDAKFQELTKARLEINDEQKRLELARRAEEDRKRESTKLEKEMVAVTKEIEVKQTQLEAAEKERAALSQQKQVMETKRSQLLAKQARKEQYSSIEERNAALGEEVKRKLATQKKSQEALQQTKKQMQECEDQRKKAMEMAQAGREQLKKLDAELRGRLAQSLAQVSEQLEQCAEQRRLLLHSGDTFLREQEEIERMVAANRQKIETSMPRQIRTAVTEVRRWIQTTEHKDAFFGTLLDNIDVEEPYRIAAESTAGNSLFNVLVADDNVAADILKFVRTQNCGSIVCTPMNQIKNNYTGNRKITYPKVHGVRPLADVVRSAEKFRPAVMQVFGRVLICQTMELCDEMTKKYGFDAITLEGDKVTSRGTMTGGHIDPSRFTKISSAVGMRAAQAKLTEVRPKIKQMNDQATELAKKQDELHDKRRAILEDRNRLKEDHRHALERTQDLESKVPEYVEAANRNKFKMTELEGLLEEIRVVVEAKRAEMSSKKLGDLSAAEQKELANLGQEIRANDVNLQALEDKVHEVGRETRAQKQHREGYLRRRLHEVQTEMTRGEQQEQHEHVSDVSKHLNRLEQEHKMSAQLLEETRAKFSESERGYKEAKHKVEELQNADLTAQEKVQNITNQLNDLMTQIKNQVARKSEFDEKLRNLPVRDGQSEFQKMTPAMITKELGAVNKALAKFEHVNKKAIDHFTMFTDQLQELHEKRDGLDRDEEAINEFIQKVDNQREETILRTLEKVDEHFRVIFSELVRGGVGKLIVMRRSTETGVEDKDGPVIGVRIHVSFTGQSTSFLTMSQLSGGQKTIVAICVIFAIQRLEPAPFYLFDEIDAALDTQYRTAIARLIQNDSKTAQMVITTFRPEIIETADQFYRVHQQNRVSRIECVSRQDARAVIQQQTLLEGIDQQ
eukprot:gnl/MRDRNA2_/MRDRNA2_95562_c0_seq1.p1 gnl/MRDRNA2_/MRDRNA2_95562_c0~~gnl/MRDRNA2_/MRDRNA2_95562_c0_seq1.p1  ORF type:complete len:1200 (-),score=338.27 gnl/MRDRNA2_/MRDRNA2_95562_c0_seq1:130-3729(-)